MKMKLQSILFVAAIFAFFTIHAQEKSANDSFAINIIFPSKTIVSKAQLDGEDRSIEIIKKTDANKTFRGAIRNYGLFTLRVDYFDSATKKVQTTSVPLFIVPGNTEIVFAVTSPLIMINGVSAAPRFEYALLMQDDQIYMDRIEKLQSKLTKYTAAGNKEAAVETKKKLDAAEVDRREKVFAGYVRKNPNSPVALYAMDLYGMINNANPLEVEALLNSMPARQQNTPKLIRLREHIEKNKTTMVGAVAPEFTQADTAGNPVALKDLQGNYVLVDFWASWCHPCRDQNPSMVKLFNKFKNKGFTILSVSLDSKKESWMAAIHHDKLTWKNVSDLHFWNNEVAILYGISSVPQNFLIDPKGKIVAKNRNAEELAALLEESYKN